MDGVLSPALAQRLVDQVAASVAHNVNIMDADGVIIASLDPSRVGTQHWAAERAATTRETVRIFADEATGSVRAGVNAPLIVEGDVIGVVGVTGEPGEVDEPANLLLLTLRLILEAETEHDARATRDALARDLLAALAAGTADTASLGPRSAAAGGMLEPPFRVVVAFDRPDSDASGVPQCAPPASAARLLRFARADSARISVADFDGLWILSSGPAVDSMDGVLRRVSEAGAAVLDSGGLDTAPALSDAVKRCRALLSVQVLIPSGGAHLNDVESEALIAAMEPATRLALASRTVAGLTEREREAIAALAEHGGSATHAAAALHLHRNSFASRLAGIVRATSRDPRNPRELQRLSLGLLAYRASR